MMDQKQTRSLFDVLQASQETFEAAQKRYNDEHKKKASYFRFSKDGTYNIRILPLAPVMDKDGNPLPMEQDGYAYHLKSLMLKIEDEKKLVKGKPSITYVTVCNAKYAFKDIDSDLIDAYVDTACDKYFDDEKLCKKLREGSFSGGLKWDIRRCMYIRDLDNPSDDIQILQLSWSQYCDLEERKMNLWRKLNSNKPQRYCPITSPVAAYPVEITRKTENGKPSYSFNIDTISNPLKLEEDTVARLFEMPRIPEQIYRYTRYHLEATIAYLTQLDKKFDIDVMNTEAVQSCIAQIKMLLPADDNSHFTLGGKNNEEKSDVKNLDSLWDTYDALEKANLDDQTAEGQDLRAAIMAFIDENDLDVKVTRRKSNFDVLNEIEDELEGGGKSKDDDEYDDDKAPASESPVVEDDDDDTDAEPETPSVDEDEEEPEPVSRRRTRNDDTNEPAVRTRRSRAPRHGRG